MKNSPNFRAVFSGCFSTSTSPMQVTLPALRSLRPTLIMRSSVLASSDMPLLTNVSVVSSDSSYTGPGPRPSTFSNLMVPRSLNWILNPSPPYQGVLFNYPTRPTAFYSSCRLISKSVGTYLVCTGSFQSGLWCKTTSVLFIFQLDLRKVSQKKMPVIVGETSSSFSAEHLRFLVTWRLHQMSGSPRSSGRST